MGCVHRMLRLYLRNVLRIIALVEMLFWCLMAIITFLVFFISDRQYFEGDVNYVELIKIRGEYGESKRNHEADATYRKRMDVWFKKILMIIAAAVLLFFCQLFLLAGLHKKNRCLIFVWILCMVGFGAFRVIAVYYALLKTDEDHLSEIHEVLYGFLLLWMFRVFYIYLAARYILQITNEIYTAEEIAPPAFRQQTYDPRLFREGLNYPKFERKLEFASRIAGLQKREHTHPKRWVPTYEAYDQDGRMVVVVDDPVYEHL